MPRRGESIYKRADGRWEARYIHHYENGKAKYRFLYASTYTEVKAKRLAELKLSERTTISTIKQNAKFDEVALLWLQEIKPNVKESTYTRYHRIIYHYLHPTLSSQLLIKLDYRYIKGMISDLLCSGGNGGKPLSSKTVGDILCVLKAIFRYGRQNGYPCTELSTLSYPAKAKKPSSILTAQNRMAIEQKLLNPEESSKANRVSLGILFTLYTGVRIGELCGLRFEDIDLHARTVIIRRTIERIANIDTGETTTESKTKVIISEPKTENSVRIIPLPKFLVDYIQRFIAPDDCYFLTGTIHYTEPHQFYLRYKTFMRQNGFGDYPFHALRHTFATYCVERGFDIKSLSEILGHSNVTTTLALYVHPTLEQKRKQMELLTPSMHSSSES